MMKKVNPQFQPPCYQTFKQDLGLGYQTANNDMLISTCDTASITRICGHHALRMATLELPYIILQIKWN
ncbi:unnamed protein product [Rhizophagus irregularis]|nr:unnamed protein product [Rhizophagus irregularis]